MINNKIYTAKDIQMYHEGKLNNADMYAMEKAALSDPFLADAMDGYHAHTHSMEGDLNELASKLVERVTQKEDATPVIPIKATNKWQWLKIAAAILIIAGGAAVFLLLNQQPEHTSIAAIETSAPSPDSSTKESIAAFVETLGKADTQTVTLNKKAAKQHYQNKSHIDALSLTDTEQPATIQQLENEHEQLFLRDTGSSHLEEIVAITALDDNNKIRPTAAERRTDSMAGALSGRVAGLAMNRDKQRKITTRGISALSDSTHLVIINGLPVKNDMLNKFSDGDIQSVEVLKDAAATAIYGSRAANGVILVSLKPGKAKEKFDALMQQQQKQESKLASQHTAAIIGLVTDTKGIPLPFTNISTDYAITYTDARGYFHIPAQDAPTNINARFQHSGISTDTLLQQNSFNNIQIPVPPAIQNRRTLQQLQQNRSARSILPVTDNEPKDGWEKYDFYLTNNIRIPDSTVNGYVELKFSINAQGRPVQIYVTHSLTNTADKEAIRLITEGPDWTIINQEQSSFLRIYF